MKVIVALGVFALGCVGLVYLGYLHGRQVYVAGYNQGYAEALYKRPVSDELEYVCAGLWVGEETRKYQERNPSGKR